MFIELHTTTDFNPVSYTHLDVYKRQVSVGGQVVNPGDVVVGDADGVVVIPAEHAAAVLALATKKEADEAVAKEKLRAGTYTKPWLEKTLAEKTGAAK